MMGPAAVGAADLIDRRRRCCCKRPRPWGRRVAAAAAAATAGVLLAAQQGVGMAAAVADVDAFVLERCGLII